MPLRFKGKEHDAKNEEEKNEYFKEYLKEWRKNNRDRCREYSMKYQHEINADPVRKAKYEESQKRWTDANREIVNAKKRERYKTNPIKQNYKAKL